MYRIGHFKDHLSNYLSTFVLLHFVGFFKKLFFGGFATRYEGPLTHGSQTASVSVEIHVWGCDR